jgi:N-acetylmuramoyl-L-alanine amidase
MHDIARIATVAVAAIFFCSIGHEGARTEPSGSTENAAQKGAGAKTNGPTCDRAAFRLVLDVGHTAQVFGATSARGLHEYDFNLRLAKVIDNKLREGGFERTTLLITDGKKRRGMGNRVARANSAAPDLFLSIHHDSVPDKFLQKWEFEGRQRGFSDRFKGHSIFVSRQNGHFGDSLQFARLLGLQLKGRGLRYTPHYVEKFMGHRQRELVDPEAGVYRYDQLLVLKDTRMPAVLLEAGSIINRDEELAMETPERQGLIAAAVVDAVDGFCAARRPHKSEPVARQPSPSPGAKRAMAPAAARSRIVAAPR